MTTQITAPTEQQLQKYAELCTEFFQTHNIFQKPIEEILAYLKTQINQNKILLLEENNEITAGLFLVKKQESETHARYKFRHLAFKNEEPAKGIIKQAETTIKKESKTAKIELTIAETEPKIKEILESLDYEQEGELKNHFRWEETTFILSKSLKQ